MKLTVIILYFVIFLSACAPLLSVSSIEEDKSRNNIIIVRNYNYLAGGYHFWPTLNGNVISGLLTKQYVSFYIPPGNTRLGVKCFGGLFPKWWHDELSLNIKIESMYYFVISPYSLGCADIKQIEYDEAVYYLDGTKQIKTGFISDCSGNSIAVNDNAPQQCWLW